jgi:hypothetical protein
MATVTIRAPAVHSNCLVYVLMAILLVARESSAGPEGWLRVVQEVSRHRAARISMT